MLRACNRVLAPGGVISFAVVVLPEGLTAVETDEAVAAGPPDVDAAGGYTNLLATAGFSDITTIDVTDEYLGTVTDWLCAWDDGAGELKQVVGEEVFAERQANRRRSIAAIGDGLLERQLISARKP